MRKVLATAVLATLILAACGGGGTSSNGGGNDYASLVAKGATAKYKITYQNGTQTPFTVAQDPPRFSYGTADSATYVTADGAAVACSGTGASATCTSLPGGGDAVRQGLTGLFGAVGSLFFSQAVKDIPGLGNITKTTSKTIAGRDAICATIDASTLGVLGAVLGDGSYSSCLDKSTGVILQSKADDGKGTIIDIKATDFGTPTDADLTPPATPITIPGVTPST